MIKPQSFSLADIRGSLLRMSCFTIPVILLATIASAGVLVAPPVVFISEQGRTGRITLQNSDDKPQEVTIYFSFGLPISDSLGNVRVTLQDSAITDPQSCIGWVKAFPRRLILPPNGSQVVRFVANPPRDLQDGEYWARVVVRSQEGKVALPAEMAEGAISATLNMIMQTAIMLKYRHGDVFSALEILGAHVDESPAQVDVIVDLKSTGNASYVGMLHCRLLDADNKKINSNSSQVAVYHELRRRVPLPIPYGEYKKPFSIQVEITNKGRTDIAAEDMIYGNDIGYTMTVE